MAIDKSWTPDALGSAFAIRKNGGKWNADVTVTHNNGKRPKEVSIDGSDLSGAQKVALQAALTTLSSIAAAKLTSADYDR